MKRIKIISFAVALCLVCSLFAAGSVVLKSAVKKEYIDLSKGAYNIIVPGDAANTDRLSAAVLTTMESWPGVSVSTAGDGTERLGAEIIIGKCNRPETAQALSLLNSRGKGYDADYIIYETGGNIAIVGNSESATEQAVNRFVNLCLADGRIESGLVYTSLASSENYTTISVNGTNVDTSYCIVTPKYNLSYIVRLQLNELTAAISQKAGYSLTEVTDKTAPEFTQANINRFLGKTWGNCESAADYALYLQEYNALDKTLSTTNYTYEIVIGNCDRTGCPEITNDDDYTIKVSGNKIFLNGGSPYATAMAVSEFTKMVNAGDVVLTDASTFTADYYDAIPGYNRSNYYTLSWADDFEGTEINENLWDISYGSENVYANGLNGRTAQRASATLNNNYVQDGCLYIAAMYDNDNYYGGHLSTKNTMRMKYGYVELSCLKPFGQGFWSSLWVDNEGLNNNGLARMEIDVNECYGPGHVTMQNSFAWLTTKGVNHLQSQYNLTIPSSDAFLKSNIKFNSDTRGFHMDFHTFGYAWDADKLTFTVDGKESFSYNYATEPMEYNSSVTSSPYTDNIDDLRAAELECTNDAFSVPSYLRLSLAVGFANRQYIVDDNADEWTASNKFVVDYVHVYQLAGQSIYIYKTANRRGDVNGDGNVDMLDSNYVARHLASWSRYDFKNMDLGAADINMDGLVTSEDLTLLNNYLVDNNSYCE